MSGALRVGLVGAGPWAQFVHAPVLAAGPETELTRVWARRPDAAASLAEAHGAAPAGSFEELLADCEAVAFCVPPDVQAAMAPVAARAGKALLLEKPLGMTVADAEAVSGAVADAGVGSLMVLTARYSPVVREFLDRARWFPPYGARALFVGGGFLGGPFSSSPWRQQHGSALDIAPHVIDLVDTAVGPIVDLDAVGDTRRFVAITARHESGAVSQISISGDCALEPTRTELELFGPGEGGELVLDVRSGLREAETFATLRAEFAAVARNPELVHDCSAARGLYLQRLIAKVQDALER